MKLGDLMFHFTRLTGIKYLVDLYNKKTGKKCKCDKRRKQWNKLKLTRK
tara:strand:+ start:478 stop:624 length:147 start_codon:yes stop_codon:yes gene_type:complete